MLLEVSGQILSRRGLDVGCGTNTLSAQELQQLCNRLPLNLSSRGANASVSISTAVLIPLDLCFTEIGQRNLAPCKPAVEGQPVPSLDVNDARPVLLFDQ